MKIAFSHASVTEWAVNCSDFCNAYGRDLDVLCLGNVLRAQTFVSLKWWFIS